MTWNEVEISREFEGRAAAAEKEADYWRRQQRAGTLGAEISHDGAVAEFFVFNYLHGRSFLSSREALLAELIEVSALRPSSSRAFDQAAFQGTRLRLIDGLIARFSQT